MFLSPGLFEQIAVFDTKKKKKKKKKKNSTSANIVIVNHISLIFVGASVILKYHLSKSFGITSKSFGKKYFLDKIALSKIII